MNYIKDVKIKKDLYKISNTQTRTNVGIEYNKYFVEEFKTDFICGENILDSFAFFVKGYDLLSEKEQNELERIIKFTKNRFYKMMNDYDKLEINKLNK
tara:strand:+ start:8632 stop:8925 length:294 start_codon:yes stop_codon:yes gene_type:complete